MKWMRLKVILIPLVMQEVDNITEIYMSKSINIYKFRFDKTIQKRRRF